MRRTVLTPVFLTLFSLLTPLWTAAPATAAEPTLDNSGNFRQEVRACREGRTAQALPTCLEEARSAEADRRRGRLTTAGSLQDNALARCQVFQTQEDKDACRARIVGHVEIFGSVAGGGILRQVAITTPAPTPPTAQTGARPGAVPGDSGSSEMGAGTRPAPAPADATEPEESLPESTDEAPGQEEGETLEDQNAPATEPVP